MSHTSVKWLTTMNDDPFKWIEIWIFFFRRWEKEREQQNGNEMNKHGIINWFVRLKFFAFISLSLNDLGPFSLFSSSFFFFPSLEAIIIHYNVWPTEFKVQKWHLWFYAMLLNMEYRTTKWRQVWSVSVPCVYRIHDEDHHLAKTIFENEMNNSFFSFFLLLSLHVRGKEAE